LINQADNHGTYPLHAALQRWRRSPYSNWHTDNAGLASAVDDLLAAGANPLARDGRGNTALHYLADDGLAEQLRAEQTRRLFKLFLDRGVDVNARNRSGRTALENLLDDSGAIEQRRVRENMTEYGKGGFPTVEEIDVEVFGWFDGAGVRWTERVSKGRSLLHIVAKHPTDKAGSRSKFLLAKGVDPLIKDDDGQTAIDVASACNNREVLLTLSAVAK
jgi:ankyrin repeat protein